MAKEATIKAFTPKRVTLDELERLRAEDAAQRRAGLALVDDCLASGPVVEGELLDATGRPLPQPPTAALPSSACSAPKTPEGPCPVCPRLAAEFEPWRQAAFYKSMHQRALERERLLKEDNQQLQARIRYLEQQLYGKKSESAKPKDSLATSTAQAIKAPGATPARTRGQQRGKPGPARRDYSHLHFEEEFHDL